MISALVIATPSGNPDASPWRSPPRRAGRSRVQIANIRRATHPGLHFVDDHHDPVPFGQRRET